MPHDPALVDETRGWLRKALEDLDIAARCLQGASRPAPAAFHSQQAVEKSFKAFLTWNGQTFRKTHSLIELGQAAIKVDRSLATVSREAAVLSGYAVEARYPGSWVDPTEQQGHDALTIAHQLYAAILALLPNEVKP